MSVVSSGSNSNSYNICVSSGSNSNSFNSCVSSGSNSSSFNVLVKQCFFNSSICLACEGNSLNPSSGWGCDIPGTLNGSEGG